MKLSSNLGQSWLEALVRTWFQVLVRTWFEPWFEYGSSHGVWLKPGSKLDEAELKPGPKLAGSLGSSLVRVLVRTWFEHWFEPGLSLGSTLVEDWLKAG